MKGPNNPTAAPPGGAIHDGYQRVQTHRFGNGAAWRGHGRMVILCET